MDVPVLTNPMETGRVPSGVPLCPAGPLRGRHGRTARAPYVLPPGHGRPPSDQRGPGEDAGGRPRRADGRTPRRGRAPQRRHRPGPGGVVRRTGGSPAVRAVPPTEVADPAPLDPPVEEEFRVGTMALAWDGEE